MSLTRNQAYGVLVLGVVLAVLAIVIDPIRGYDIYLHWSQIVALIVGVVLALFGAYIVFVKKPL